MSIYSSKAKVICKFNGKEASFIGDSITYGYHSTINYVTYLNSLIGFSAANNYGINNSTLAVGSDPMCDRIDTVSSTSDIIFVFGGTNDFEHNVPIGDWYTTDSSGTRTFNESNATFRGALTKLCLGLRSRFPTKDIVLLTPLHRNVYSNTKTDLQKNSQDKYLEDYVNCIKEAGAIFSVKVIDLYSDTGMFPYNSDNADEYYATSYSDQLHPSNNGHKRIAEVIANALSQM